MLLMTLLLNAPRTASQTKYSPSGFSVKRIERIGLGISRKRPAKRKFDRIGHGQTIGIARLHFRNPKGLVVKRMVMIRK